jgi:hypothetical protein
VLAQPPITSIAVAAIANTAERIVPNCPTVMKFVRF